MENTDLSSALAYLVVKMMEMDPKLIIENNKVYKLSLKLKFEIDGNKLKKVIFNKVKFKQTR